MCRSVLGVSKEEMLYGLGGFRFNFQGKPVTPPFHLLLHPLFPSHHQLDKSLPSLYLSAVSLTYTLMKYFCSRENLSFMCYQYIYIYEHDWQ